MNLYRSDHGTAFLDQRGFLEVVIAKHSMFTREEVDTIAATLEKQGISEISALVSRLNEYAVPKDFNILDLSKIGTVRFQKVAVYALSPGDRTFAQLMGITAFKNVPYEVFKERAVAIDWLLSDDIPAASD